jgi:hypothetical protein
MPEGPQVVREGSSVEWILLFFDAVLLQVLSFSSSHFLLPYCSKNMMRHYTVYLYFR